MSYNDGYVHLDFYNQEAGKEKIAEEFSEGDSLLSNALLELWNNNIKTTACCRGHGENRNAYISFIINNDSKKLIQATCEYLYLQDGIFEINFIADGHNKDYDTFCVSMGSDQDKESYLTFLHQALNYNDDIKGVGSNIPIYADNLLKFARSKNLDCRYLVNKNEMMFGYANPGTLLIFDGDVPTLSDMNSSIKETGNLQLRPISCDEESLEQFINLIYPDTFTVISDLNK